MEKALYNFGSSLGKVQLYKFHYCGICVTDFEKGMEPMPPIHEQPWKGPGNLERSTLSNETKTVRKNVIPFTAYSSLLPNNKEIINKH